MSLLDIISKRVSVGHTDGGHVVLLTGIPGVGKTSRARVVADSLALTLGPGVPVCFIDLDIFGFRIAGHWYVQVPELVRTLALIYNQGVRHFILAGTCSNFSLLCHELKNVGRVSLVVLEGSPGRILQVQKLRGADSSNEQVTADDQPSSDAIPETEATIQSWMTNIREIVRKRAESYGYSFDVVNDEGGGEKLPSAKENGGRGVPTIRAVKRKGSPRVEIINRPEESEIYGGVSYVPLGSEKESLLVPTTVNLFPHDSSNPFHEWPLSSKILRTGDGHKSGWRMEV